jgi:hypothetical protein
MIPNNFIMYGLNLERRPLDNTVACFANAGTVEARSIESSTQQKENKQRTQQ